MSVGEIRSNDSVAATLLGVLSQLPTLGTAAALDEIVDVVVGKLADFCGIDLAIEGIAGERVVKCAEWVNPGVRDTLAAQRWSQPSWRGHPVTTSLLTSGSLEVSVLEPDGAAIMVPHAEFGAAAIELGLSSLIVVPLRNSNGAFGTLALASLSNDRFDATHLVAARLVANAITIAVGNESMPKEDIFRGNQTLFDASPLAMVECNSDGQILEVNEAFSFLVGRAQEEVLGTLLRHHTSPYDADDEEPLWHALLKGEIATYDIDKRIVDCGGDELWTSCTVTRVDDAASQANDDTRIMVFLQDIRAAKQLEEHVTHTVFHDTLTGLANRLTLQDSLAAALSAPDRRIGSVGLLYIDLDRFRTFNERLGHEKGDELLVAVSRRLHAAIGPADLLARLTNDEFAVLVEELDGDSHAQAVGERLVDALSVPIPITGMQVLVHASIGVAVCGAPGESVHADGERLLADAQHAMRMAKNQTRSRYATFDPSAKTRAASRLALEMELASLDAHQLDVGYQPIFSSRTRRVVGVESLARWIHPTRGELPASEFIEVAERSSLILPIGTFLMAQTFETASHWLNDAELSEEFRVSVNISTKELLRSRVEEVVLSAAQRHGLAAHRVLVEIDEKSFAQTPEIVRRSIERCSAAGLGVGIDNCGRSGSLSVVIRDLPIVQVKLAPEIVKRANTPAGLGWATALVQGAHACQINVVAKGLEVDGEVDRAIAMGVDGLQGSILAPPLDSDTISTLLLGRG